LNALGNDRGKLNALAEVFDAANVDAAVTSHSPLLLELVPFESVDLIVNLWLSS
jgi:hypothetical protein